MQSWIALFLWAVAQFGQSNTGELLVIVADPGRLNLINFAGLFSGTAVALPRSFAMRLRTEF